MRFLIQLINENGPFSSKFFNRKVGAMPSFKIELLLEWLIDLVSSRSLGAHVLSVFKHDRSSLISKFTPVPRRQDPSSEEAVFSGTKIMRERSGVPGLIALHFTSSVMIRLVAAAADVKLSLYIITPF